MNWSGETGKRVEPAQVRTRLISLFDAGMPASLRCFAVLDGSASGLILADDPAAPTWGAVWEAGSGTLYLGGGLDGPLVHRLIAELRTRGDVLVGFWDTDDQAMLLPPDPDYDGQTLEFVARTASGLDDHAQAIPAGCELCRLDRDLLERCASGKYYAAVFGSPGRALEHGLGLCLVRDDEILCEAFAGPAARGQIEISTTTPERYRGRGYATTTCAHLVRGCEARGLATYWNCAKQNAASASVARKLGYRGEREYRLVAWFRSPNDS